MGEWRDVTEGFGKIELPLQTQAFFINAALVRVEDEIRMAWGEYADVAQRGDGPGTARALTTLLDRHERAVGLYRRLFDIIRRDNEGRAVVERNAAMLDESLQRERRWLAVLR